MKYQTIEQVHADFDFINNQRAGEPARFAECFLVKKGGPLPVGTTDKQRQPVIGNNMSKYFSESDLIAEANKMEN